MRSASRRDGFTLLELAIALAVAAITLGVGVPGLGAWLAEQQLQERAEALLRTLDLARSEAVRHGARVDVCPAPGTCDAALPWEGGWSVTADDARDGGAPPLFRERRAAAGITVRGNRPVADYVSYTSLGQARRFDGALQMGTFTVCRSGLRARRVVLANSGRARIDTAGPVCP